MIYTVQAFRFGDTDKHSYICGVFSSKEAAIERAEYEEDYRDGKYKCQVMGWEPDDLTKTVMIRRMGY